MNTDCLQNPIYSCISLCLMHLETSYLSSVALVFKCCMICSCTFPGSLKLMQRYSSPECAAEWSSTSSYFLVKGNSCLEWCRILGLSAFRICPIFFWAKMSKWSYFGTIWKKLNLYLKLVSHIFWKAIVLMLCMVLTTNRWKKPSKIVKICKWKIQSFLYNLGDQESCSLEGVIAAVKGDGNFISKMVLRLLSAVSGRQTRRVCDVMFLSDPHSGGHMNIVLTNKTYYLRCLEGK